MYLPESQLIKDSKWGSLLKLLCVFKADIIDFDGVSKDFVYLSGDPLVVENNVVEAIVTALWNTKAGTSSDGSTVTFGEVVVRADPNFFMLQKVELVPLGKSIFSKKNDESDRFLATVISPLQ